MEPLGGSEVPRRQGLAQLQQLRPHARLDVAEVELPKEDAQPPTVVVHLPFLGGDAGVGLLDSPKGLREAGHHRFQVRRDLGGVRSSDADVGWDLRHRRLGRRLGGRRGRRRRRSSHSHSHSRWGLGGLRGEHLSGRRGRRGGRRRSHGVEERWLRWRRCSWGSRLAWDVDLPLSSVPSLRSVPSGRLLLVLLVVRRGLALLLIVLRLVAVASPIATPVLLLSVLLSLGLVVLLGLRLVVLLSLTVSLVLLGVGRVVLLLRGRVILACRRGRLVRRLEPRPGLGEPVPERGGGLGELPRDAIQEAQGLADLTIGRQEVSIHVQQVSVGLAALLLRCKGEDDGLLHHGVKLGLVLGQVNVLGPEPHCVVQVAGADVAKNRRVDVAPPGQQQVPKVAAKVRPVLGLGVGAEQGKGLPPALRVLLLHQSLQVVLHDRHQDLHVALGVLGEVGLLGLGPQIRASNRRDEQRVGHLVRLQAGVHRARVVSHEQSVLDLLVDLVKFLRDLRWVLRHLGLRGLRRGLWLLPHRRGKGRGDPLQVVEEVLVVEGLRLSELSVDLVQISVQRQVGGVIDKAVGVSPLRLRGLGRLLLRGLVPEVLEQLLPRVALEQNLHERPKLPLLCGFPAPLELLLAEGDHGFLAGVRCQLSQLLGVAH